MPKRNWAIANPPEAGAEIWTLVIGVVPDSSIRRAPLYGMLWVTVPRSVEPLKNDTVIEDGPTFAGSSSKPKVFDGLESVMVSAVWLMAVASTRTGVPSVWGGAPQTVQPLKPTFNPVRLVENVRVWPPPERDVVLARCAVVIGISVVNDVY